MKTVYTPHGVCSTQIEVELSGDIITHVQFTNGCNGNTQGVARLVEGMRAQDAIEKLRGIDCRGRGTSCPDQLSRALEEALHRAS
ncbi:MAG: TIGR03905 family TSCPD domain-containing protein [Lachnospiraceae bacterium]|nr:TIGR03905 family TSCPD domain-containing protein [Lachnospiraceae bacterium]